MKLFFCTTSKELPSAKLFVALKLLARTRPSIRGHQRLMLVGVGGVDVFGAEAQADHAGWDAAEDGEVL